jgi:hypothetical protein
MMVPLLAALAGAAAISAIAIACRIKRAERSWLRLVRAIRRGPQQRQAANDNARQSFVYKIEHRTPRRW